MACNCVTGTQCYVHSACYELRWNAAEHELVKRDIIFRDRDPPRFSRYRGPTEIFQNSSRNLPTVWHSECLRKRPSLLSEIKRLVWESRVWKMERLSLASISWTSSDKATALSSPAILNVSVPWSRFDKLLARIVNTQ